MNNFYLINIKRIFKRINIILQYEKSYLEELQKENYLPLVSLHAKNDNIQQEIIKTLSPDIEPLEIIINALLKV